MPPRATEVFFRPESARPPRTAPFAVRPGEHCRAKMPPRCCGGVFPPGERPDHRKQRPLPPGPANIAAQKRPRAAAEVFFRPESARPPRTAPFAVRPGERCRAKMPPALLWETFFPPGERPDRHGQRPARVAGTPPPTPPPSTAVSSTQKAPTRPSPAGGLKTPNAGERRVRSRRRSPLPIFLPAPRPCDSPRRSR